MSSGTPRRNANPPPVVIQLPRAHAQVEQHPAHGALLEVRGARGVAEVGEKEAYPVTERREGPFGFGERAGIAVHRDQVEPGSPLQDRARVPSASHGAVHEKPAALGLEEREHFPHQHRRVIVLNAAIIVRSPPHAPLIRRSCA